MFIEEEEPFCLENSKYATLEKFKSSLREKVDIHPPRDLSSGELLTIRSDETGHVLHHDIKSCQAKKKGPETTEAYLEARKTENEDFIAASLHAVESLAPFNLKRVYGRLEDVPVINLTGIYRNHIVYASSNVIIVFDYVENSQKCLQGHRNTITSLQMDKKGRFIVSSAAGKRNLLIVWDIMTGKPLKYIHNAHAGNGCTYACFTGMDYIFASVGAEEIGKQTISFWNFNPKDSAKIPIVTGNFPKTATSTIRELTFLDKRPEFFAATGNKNVIFGTWIRDKKGDSVHLHKPRLRKNFIVKHKRFTCSLWMKKGEWLATATGAGYVVIWGYPVVLALEEPPDPTKNIREFQRSFKLSEKEISVFTIYKEYVVIGDETGIVRFFDNEFKLLQWTRNFALPAIQSVSFNYTEEPPEFKKNLREKFVAGDKKYLRRQDNSCVRDYTHGGSKFRQVSKTTIPQPPMPCPDFVIAVAGGDIYYYHFNESQVDRLVQGTPGHFIACDACPGSNHVLFSTAKGEIQLYDFNKHQLIFSNRIFSGSHRISTLKFHPMGQMVAFGLTDGHICFRWNFTWKTAMPAVLTTQNSISRIIFTPDGLHLAYYDDMQTVVVLKYLPKGHGWMVLGTSKTHYLPIADLLFFVGPEQGGSRLFSLGLDRHLIEYDIDQSSGDIGLYIVKITSLEETARPYAMVFDGPIDFGIDCITFSNNINKIRMFSLVDEKVKRTCSGPVFGRGKGINRMIEFPTQMSQHRFKKFIVYVVRNKLGLMDTPVDGNPHKYMAVYTHPREILEVAVVPDRERIFTIGKKDNSAYVWSASPRALEATVLMGGSGIAPFYHTIRSHWGSQDIVKDLDLVFFYLNVKRIAKQTELFTMNRSIKLCEISTVCRACGFFPSEYEVGLMMDEARRVKQADRSYTDDFLTEYTFDEFIKLFVNHFYRMMDEDIEEAFKDVEEMEGGEEEEGEEDEFEEEEEYEFEDEEEYEVAEEEGDEFEPQVKRDSEVGEKDDFEWLDDDDQEEEEEEHEEETEAKHEEEEEEEHEEETEAKHEEEEEEVVEKEED